MLNSSLYADYKKLAKQTTYLECSISEKPFGTIIVDFRSRLFRYMRLAYINRPFHEKINSVFLAMNENTMILGRNSEKKKVFHGALELTKKEVARLQPKKCIYVFCSPHTCPYKERIKADRNKMCEKRLQEFDKCINEFKRDVLNVEILKKCFAALESYIMSDVENICAMYAGKEWLLGVENYIYPGSDEYYESDRLCATLARKKNSGYSPAVLSEDLDCTVLFGAEFMIKEVFEQFISYVSLKDIMNVFGVNSRKDLVHRCCIMGTHFNLGLKGVGPVKVKKLDNEKATELWLTCLKHQHINPKDFYKFLLVHEVFFPSYKLTI